ncbi:MAG: potassium transporter TrkG [Bacteroidales bacterium]
MKLINPLVILRILSIILFVEVVSFLLCIPSALYYSESILPFLLPALITSVISSVLYFLSRNADIDKLSSRDGYFSVTLSWLIFPLLGTLPYLFSGTIPSFINAFFESTSGFTTTGSSILTNVENLPRSVLFWRSLTHWIGGIGIIVLVLLVLPSLKVAGYQLFSLESNLKEKILPRTKAIGLRIILVYLTLTIAEIIFLSFGDMSLFDSICYSFGTISTGGFSTKSTGMMSYSPYSQYIVMTFMFLAGISQIVYYYIIKLNLRKVKHNEELWFYIATIVISGALATSILLVKTDKSLEPAIREGYFQVISIITCTGFSSANFAGWPMAGTLLLFILMFSGGSTCSTSGRCGSR